MRLVEDGVFEENERILIDAKSVAYVVGELEPFSLLKTDKDIVGDAFEVFAESKFVGEKGEFFTPREVVKMCVRIIDPRPNEKILDRSLRFSRLPDLCARTRLEKDGRRS